MADVDRNINVTAKLDSNDNVYFSMSGDGVSGERIEFDKNKTPNMKKNDHYLVSFTLVDETKLGLRYVKPKKESMWVKLITDNSDASCPAPNDDLDQFKANEVTDTVLKVRNKDMQKETLKFALNFIRSGGNDNNIGEYVQFDPFGDNENGGLEMHFSAVNAALIVGGVVITVAVVTKAFGLW